MPLRFLLFFTLMVLHCVVIVCSPAWLASCLAASIYVPLMLFQAVSLPVFATAPSGGWAAPSLLGWCILVIVWGAIWFGVASWIARALKKTAMFNG